jgi:hypothetical protein
MIDRDLLDVTWVGEDHVEVGVEVCDQFDVLAKGPPSPSMHTIASGAASSNATNR